VGGAGADVHAFGGDLHRRRALEGGAVAELAVAVVADGPDAAVGFDEEGVGASGGKTGDTGGDLHGLVAVGGGAVAELTVAVFAKAPEGAVGLEKEGVVVADGQAGHSGGERRGRGDGRFPECAVAGEVEAFVGAGRDGDHVLGELDGRGIAVALEKAELAAFVGAETPEAAVGLDEETVVLAHGDLGDARGQEDRRRGGGEDGGVAGEPEGAVAFQEERGAEAGGDRLDVAGGEFGRERVEFGHAGQLVPDVASDGQEGAVRLEEQGVLVGGRGLDGSAEDALREGAAVARAVGELAVFVVAGGEHVVSVAGRDGDRLGGAVDGAGQVAHANPEGGGFGKGRSEESRAGRAGHGRGDVAGGAAIPLVRQRSAGGLRFESAVAAPSDRGGRGLDRDLGGDAAGDGDGGGVDGAGGVGDAGPVGGGAGKRGRDKARGSRARDGLAVVAGGAAIPLEGPVGAGGKREVQGDVLAGGDGGRGGGERGGGGLFEERMVGAGGDGADPALEAFGRATVFPGAVAELAVAVHAHAPESGVGAEEEAVKGPGGDGGDSVGHANGRGVAWNDGVAELAVGVVADGPEAAVGFQEERVGVAGGHAEHVGRDEDRRGAAGQGAVAELAGEVGSGRPEAAVGLEEQAMKFTAGEADDAVHEAHRRETVDHGAVAELALFVEAHAPEAAVGFLKEAVRAAGGDAGDAVRDLDRGAAVDGGAVAQLALGVGADGPERAARVDPKPVIGAGGKGDRPGAERNGRDAAGEGDPGARSPEVASGFEELAVVGSGREVGGVVGQHHRRRHVEVERGAGLAVVVVAAAHEQIGGVGSRGRSDQTDPDEGENERGEQGHT